MPPLGNINNKIHHIELKPFGVILDSPFFAFYLYFIASPQPGRVSRLHPKGSVAWHKLLKTPTNIY